MARRICVFGAGYLGLTSAVCYAHRGDFVSIYEKDEDKRNAISQGRSPFFEPGLDELLSEAVDAGRLEVVTDPALAVGSSDCSFVTVGTPTMTDGSVDLSDLLAACRDIAQGIRHCTSFHVLVIRSTVFPGTTSDLVRETVEKHSGKRVSEGFGLVAYPEFLREGYAVHDMLHPDRIVLGELDNHSGDVMEAFVREFYGRDLPPVLRVSPTTAELVKYASNAFLATKVAFVNEIANLCERFNGVDVRHVADGMGYDPRIGRRFLDAGLGFGGSCLPKDLRALVEGAGRMGLHLRIAEAALASNEVQPLRVVSLAEETIGDLKGRRAAVLGLAFKPGTDDMREASSQKVVRALLQAGMRVSVYDPQAMRRAATIFGGSIRYARDVADCLKGADCCFIVTEWEEFRELRSDVFVEAMPHPVVIDGRRVLNPSKLDPRICYRAIGLGKRGHG